MALAAVDAYKDWRQTGSGGERNLGTAKAKQSSHIECPLQAGLFFSLESPVFYIVSKNESDLEVLLTKSKALHHAACHVCQPGSEKTTKGTQLSVNDDLDKRKAFFEVVILARNFQRSFKRTGNESKS